ncbi:hypothetical protein BUALT_Bualt07G0049700 [Buddleja alternifolia]|uniref:Pectinesterase inhibitor domain-containing protein n=1 Tax=Buddleja alternifolia TaxID=168488 RepID=A0AAV6XGA4_9LAMI|nr:hypothetical protein BUALT_Bualt07G0049700 [Buddleja alternifolia]
MATNARNPWQTQDPAFCTRVLGSDPRTFKAKLPELASVTIDLALNSVTGTKVRVHSLYLSEKNPQMRAHFGTCEACFADALDALRLAPRNLKHGEYAELNIVGTSVFDDGLRCENSFKPPSQSPLRNENNDSKRFGDIIVAIANSLENQHKI